MFNDVIVVLLVDVSLCENIYRFLSYSYTILMFHVSCYAYYLSLYICLLGRLSLTT